MMHTTAVALALALLAGAVAWGANVSAADGECDGAALAFQDTEQDTVSGTEVDRWAVDVPLVDPVTLQQMTSARLKIDVTTLNADVAWEIFRVDATCGSVDSSGSAGEIVDATFEPDETYYIHVWRSAGTTAVDYAIVVEPHSFL